MFLPTSPKLSEEVEEWACDWWNEHWVPGPLRQSHCTWAVKIESLVVGPCGALWNLQNERAFIIETCQ